MTDPAYKLLSSCFILIEKFGYFFFRKPLALLSVQPKQDILLLKKNKNKKITQNKWNLYKQTKNPKENKTIKKTG